MLAQVDTTRCPWLLGKIIKTIGKKSKMKQLSELQDLEDVLRDQEAHAWDTVGDALRRITEPKVNSPTFQEKVKDMGGLQFYLEDVLDTLVSKKHKPGSQKDTAIKLLQRFHQDLLTKKRDIERLRAINEEDTLDSSQRTAIRYIKDGESVLLMGNPGTGKTTCALYTLDLLAVKKCDECVLYVAPTMELTLQAFANLSETFPSLSVGIVTTTIVKTFKKPHILVGTPLELWAFLSTNSTLQWTTTIVDEVHTITTEEFGYADAIKHLLGGMSKHTNKTLVALSATINPDDVEPLRDFLCGLAGVDQMRVITLDPSPVQVKHFYVEASGLIRSRDKDIPSPTNVKTTPELMFRTLKRLGYDGTLVFAHNDIATWKLFNELLQWLERMNDRYYHSIIRIADEVNALVEEAQRCASEVSRLENTTRTGALRSLREFATKDTTCRIQAKAMLLDALRKDWNHHRSDTFSATATQADAMVAKNHGVQGIEEGTNVPLSVKYLLSEVLVHESIPFIPCIGPYFSLTLPHKRVENREFEAFSKMNVKKNMDGKDIIKMESESESEWSAVNTLKKFAEAEGMGILDIKESIKLTVKALRYGIALMMPAFPFVITQTIRRYLNDRQIPFIFATQDLAVGINYPLRNVAIVSDPDEPPLLPSLLKQMAGRAGRRGFDKDARIVTINVPCMEHAVERLSLQPPIHAAAAVSMESALCCLWDAKNLVHDLKLAFRDNLSMSDTLQVLMDSVRRETGAELLLKVVEDDKENLVLSKEEALAACDTLQDIRYLLAACQHIHWVCQHYNEEVTQTQANKIWNTLRRANHGIISFCF